MARRYGLPLSALVAGLVGGLVAPKMPVVYAPERVPVTSTAAPETLWQQPPTQEPPAPAPAPLLDPASAARVARIEALTSGLIGSWRLVRMTPAPPARPPRQVSGLLLVSDHVLSLTLHANPEIVGKVVPGTRVQGGAHYWRIGPQETLETAAIIGHDNFLQDLALEPQFEPREWEVEIVGRVLLLRKRDGTRLEFERLDVQSFPPQAVRFIDAMRRGQDLDDLRGR